MGLNFTKNARNDVRALRMLKSRHASRTKSCQKTRINLLLLFPNGLKKTASVSEIWRCSVMWETTC